MRPLVVKEEPRLFTRPDFTFRVEGTLVSCLRADYTGGLNFALQSSQDEWGAVSPSLLLNACLKLIELLRLFDLKGFLSRSDVNDKG